MIITTTICSRAQDNKEDQSLGFGSSCIKM
jgi:hypothetical protein